MATANEKTINAVCDWAKQIAADNSFHYGRSKWAHHGGCFFVELMVIGGLEKVYIKRRFYGLT